MIDSPSMVKPNKTFRNLLILICPFIIMSLINEIEKPKIEYKSYNQNSSVITINAKDFNTKKCTWTCHNLTKHCKTNHVKILKPYFAFTDTPYLWVIHTSALFIPLQKEKITSCKFKINHIVSFNTCSNELDVVP
jgi:hypothetical protein